MPRRLNGSRTPIPATSLMASAGIVHMPPPTTSPVTPTREQSDGPCSQTGTQVCNGLGLGEGATVGFILGGEQPKQIRVRGRPQHLDPWWQRHRSFLPTVADHERETILHRKACSE